MPSFIKIVQAIKKLNSISRARSNFRRQQILCITLYRNLMQVRNFGGTFDQIFLWISFWNFHRRCLSISSIPWCKKVKNDQKLKSRGGGGLIGSVHRVVQRYRYHWSQMEQNCVFGVLQATCYGCSITRNQFSNSLKLPLSLPLAYQLGIFAFKVTTRWNEILAWLQTLFFSFFMYRALKNLKTAITSSSQPCKESCTKKWRCCRRRCWWTL